ncbi:minor capsid protein [Betapolyomavirus vicugnae]|nr:minor capsid protein [Betapolyomavirus vicugnae]ARA71319.1 minor capsid protein [Betapolyomavirus vicugnae]
MDAAVVPYNELEVGIPGIPDWVLNMLPELPSLSDIFSRIAHGIWTSYYNAGRIVVQRALSSEMQQLLRDLRNGFSSTLQGIEFSDPVQAIANQIERIQAQRRIDNARLLSYAERNQIDVSNIVTALQEGAQTAAGALRDAGGAVVGQVGNLAMDIANLPIDGYNALSDGVHRFGQWISISGPTGGTEHYSFPDWMLYLLEEVETDFTPRVPLKRKLEENNGNQRKKRSTGAKTSSKTSKTSKKRRS